MDVTGNMSGHAGEHWLIPHQLDAKLGQLILAESDSNDVFVSMAVYLVLGIISAFTTFFFWNGPGGSTWASFRARNERPIPGPRGLLVIGSLLSMGDQAHRNLEALAIEYKAKTLMALSMGKTRYVIASTPESAREILHSAAFSSRPIKQSAQQLLFHRAIGFAPQGEYWRKLRRIASTHLFSPKRIATHEAARQEETKAMINAIDQASVGGTEGVQVRSFLQRAALNNVMSSVMGRKFDFGSSAEADRLQAMVREGFEVLGAFNWADHLPFLQALDPQDIHGRCADLVPRVIAFVQNIIDEHRASKSDGAVDSSQMDFVDVLLSLPDDDKLSDSDMISVLWEMIFRGTDTMAIVTEWALAELVLNPDVQRAVKAEIEAVVELNGEIRDHHVNQMPYLQGVVKETLRLHPPGPLLSWARLSNEDTTVAGFHVPKGTTAMVNMHAITHDAAIWDQPLQFRPQRFVSSLGGTDFDVKGSDTKLAPFGAGRRVCPGRALGMTTIQLWIAKLVNEFEWVATDEHPVDLTEVLKLSAEMVKPLTVRPVHRT